MSCYKRLPITFVKGSGVWLTDQNGQDYLDALSGIAVCALGHSHPEITRVISDQAKTLLHTSNIYHIHWQQALAKKLTELSNMDNAFFANSGAEANEVAIKIARLFGHKLGIDAPTIITATGSFHGRTLATISASGNTKIQQNFSPLVERFIHVPYDNIKAIQKIQDTSVVAVMLEPIQGEGGVQIPRDGYLDQVRSICTERNWLLIFDEVQTGMCRTGEWFAFQHEKAAQPDVLTLAKALGNGIPIGACLAKGIAANLMQPGNHASTFGGNPLATRVGLTVINILLKQKLLLNASQFGAQMLASFKIELGSIKGVVSIRGKGLILGIELDRECTQIVDRALEHYLLLNVTANNVIRILPPLIIDAEIAQMIVEKVVYLVKEFLMQE